MLLLTVQSRPGTVPGVILARRLDLLFALIGFDLPVNEPDHAVCGINSFPPVCYCDTCYSEMAYRRVDLPFVLGVEMRRAFIKT